MATINIQKLNTLTSLLEREERRSRDNRQNGKYWSYVWETYKELQNVMRALEKHVRIQRSSDDLENFPEISNHACKCGYWYYVGKDIRIMPAVMYHGNGKIRLSGYAIQHTYMNAENSWSVPELFGRMTDTEYTSNGMIFF